MGEPGRVWTQEDIDNDMDDEPFICPLSHVACVRAFCEDYGCADKLRVPADEYDVEAGSIHPDELVHRIPRARRKKK